MSGRIIVLSILLISLSSCQTAAEPQTDLRTPGAIGAGLLCASLKGKEGKSCDDLCTARIMNCTGVNSPITPFDCATKSDDEVTTICRCRRIVQ